MYAVCNVHGFVWYCKAMLEVASGIVLHCVLCSGGVLHSILSMVVVWHYTEIYVVDRDVRGNA